MKSDPTLQFLKLGGSLITDKAQPRTPRLDVLVRLASEIAAARTKNPKMCLLLGHGSGSFGHVSGRKHGTRQGVHTATQWRGFIEVWRDAGALNRLVMDALLDAGLPAIAFPPSSSVLAEDGRVKTWDLRPLQSALDAGLIPVVFGDTVFDSQRGGTILSTEDLFAHLALVLWPKRILLAGIESGVWADYPACTRLFPEITPATLPEIEAVLSGAATTDVTGGMASKVRQSLALVEAIPALETCIFSGIENGAVARALGGDQVGTTIRE